MFVAYRASVSDSASLRLPAVPGLRGLSVLAHGGYAIETVVEKRGVNRLIPELKAAGASDILELPISKIVP